MDHSTMEYRIGLEKQNKPNDQVTELILDNCRASQISGLTEEFVNLETLSLINVGLVTLKGFPKLPKLKKLELSDNRLTGGLYLLHGSPKLQHLNISGNRIKDLEALEPLKEFHDLVNLDLYNCEVTKSDNYRQKVFELLPNLNSLDGYDRNEREVADSDESEDEGSDVENRITRDDNEEVVEDEEEEDEQDVDEDEDNIDESGSSEFEGDENGNVSDFQEDFDDEENDDDDDDDEEGDEDDDDDDDDDDEENYSEDERAERRAFEAAPVGAMKEDSSGHADQLVENGGDNDDDDDDDDDDDEEEEESDNEGLKKLQRDLVAEDDEDDDDFEPTQEPDERDYEIDPEDDADEDDVSSAHLSTSGIDSEADAKLRGQKRKHEDEGGDEVGDD